MFIHPLGSVPVCRRWASLSYRRKPLQYNRQSVSNNSIDLFYFIIVSIVKLRCIYIVAEDECYRVINTTYTSIIQRKNTIRLYCEISVCSSLVYCVIFVCDIYLRLYVYVGVVVDVNYDNTCSIGTAGRYTMSLFLWTDYVILYSKSVTVTHRLVLWILDHNPSLISVIYIYS